MDWPIGIANGWHPVARASDVGLRRPIRARLLGQDLVIFRDGTKCAVFADRCPHRGVPLSYGTVRDGVIACAYHGWRFDTRGRCIEVPGAPTCIAARLQAFPTRVEAGFIWTSFGATPAPFPTLPDAIHDETLDRFWWHLGSSEAGLLDALENHLDPAHPHFLHPWIVRAPTARHATQVDVRTGPWGAEAIYTEARRNQGLISRVMEGSRIRSIGRLWPPTMGEVRLEAARGRMLSIVVVFVPVAHGLTQPLAHFASTRGVTPAWLKKVLLQAFHWPVLSQDRRMLRIQNRARTDQKYVVGPMDVLATAIWRFANGEVCTEEVKSTEMHL